MIEPLPEALLPGLRAYKSYLDRCTVDPTIFSGAHLRQLIDNFGSNLVTHLSDEIPTLISLTPHGSKLPLLQMINNEAMNHLPRPLSQGVRRSFSEV